MTTFILKVLLCQALFYLGYKMILERSTDFVFNRYYLLFALIASCIIPQIELNLFDLPSHESSFQLPYSQVVHSPVNLDNSEGRLSPTFLDFGILMYLVITAIFAVRLLRNLWLMHSKVRSNGKHILPEFSTIILMNEPIIPHSFFRYIFLCKSTFQEGSYPKEILLHEDAHVKQWHSFDVLFTEVFQCIMWFSPFVYLIKKEIKINHEYLADQEVIKSEINIYKYQNLILSTAQNPSLYTYASLFNYYITKKRLIMMTKSQSKANNMATKFLVLPIVVSGLLLFSKDIYAQGKASAKEKTIVPITTAVIQSGGVEEFNNIFAKGIVKTQKSTALYLNKYSKEEIEKMYSIYTRMGEEEQKQLNGKFIFLKDLQKKQIPTKEEFESYKNEKNYGVWIDSKRINNSELSKYQNTDFYSVSKSRLAKNAAHYGKYVFHLTLTTKEKFEKIESSSEYILTHNLRGK